MSAIQELLPEFDHEMATTRRVLERVPADRLTWKPHPKSRSLGELATHVAELARWGIRFQKDSFQIGSEAAPPMKTAEDFVTRFDANVKDSREKLAGMGDDRMQGEFTVLKPSGEVFFKIPRHALLRSVLLSHLIHHRGQLTVYLRENDVPLPSIYGPTADEPI
ncbi:MAG TPA: DinB family protein [Thermoanaerobaculia bacterium]|nr:DinB family protein [Thermoanaerobaculia bacterium]